MSLVVRNALIALFITIALADMPKIRKALADGGTAKKSDEDKEE